MGKGREGNGPSEKEWSPAQVSFRAIVFHKHFGLSRPLILGSKVSPKRRGAAALKALVSFANGGRSLLRTRFLLSAVMCAKSFPISVRVLLVT